MPGADPNMMTDSLVAHLALEHRARQHDYEDGPMRHMRRIYQASRIGLGGASNSSGGGSSHRSSPFSLRSRNQPQAMFGNGSSNAPAIPSASSFLNSLVSSAPSGGSTSAGPPGASGQLVQDTLSQDLVELITQMSHADTSSGNELGWERRLCVFERLCAYILPVLLLCSTVALPCSELYALYWYVI